MHETKKIKISQIYLDLNNPRIERQASEQDVIQLLLAQEGVKPLARDIATAGATSPLELVAVFPHDRIANAFITAEGNRRLCALKLISDPEKAAKEADRKYFRRLRDQIGQPITELSAVVFPSFEAARPWVERRHEGEQGGIGTKNWTAEQKARFNSRGKGDNPNSLAVELVDYARSHALLSPAELNTIAVTTITRYLGTPDVRSALGLSQARILEINVPEQEFQTGLKKFLSDALGATPSVNSRANSAARKDYAERFRTDDAAPKTRGQPAYTPGESVLQAKPAHGAADGHDEAQPMNSAAPPVFGASSTQPTRNSRHPEARRYVVPSDFKANIKDKHLVRLYRELRTLPAEDFPFASVYLLRTVIESSTALYLKSKGVQPKSKLHEKLKQLVDQLAADGMTDKELKFLRTLASNGIDDPYSPDSLGNIVHGQTVPAKGYAIRYWDNMERILTRTLNAV